MIRLIAIAFALLYAGSASAQTVRFPSVAVGGSAAGPEISGWMYKPSGAGPFAAIVLAHTCAGVSLHTARREVGVRQRQRGERQHARERRGWRDRLPQCPVVRAQG